MGAVMLRWVCIKYGKEFPAGFLESPDEEYKIKYIRQVRHMVNIYETEGGKLNALQDFEEGCWVKVTAATMWEMEPVAKKYNIDIEDMRACIR